MNDIAVRPARANELELPVAVAEPDISSDLRLLFGRVQADRMCLVKRDAVLVGHVEEARQLLPFYAGICAVPVRGDQGRRMVFSWMVKLNRGMQFALDDRMMTGMLDAVMSASGDLPLAVINADTLATALRTLARCSTSGIDGVLRPAGQRLTGTHSFLKSVIATYVPPKVAAPTLSDQARDAMLAGFRQEMAAIPASNLRLPPDGQVTATPKPRPNHAVPAALLAFYEKQAEQPGRFQGAAQMRVDALRRQLAKGTPPPDA